MLEVFKFISLKLLSSDEHFDKVGNRNFSAEIYISDDVKERKLIVLRYLRIIFAMHNF